MDQMKKKIIEFVLENGCNFRLYREDSDFEQPDDWPGRAPGLNGGEIHLIAQTDESALYAETTDSMEGATHLITSSGVQTPEHEMLCDLLDELFGPQAKWPDNYAQTRGWKI